MHNVVTLVGNVSRTPELRHTTSGAAVAWENGNGEKRSKATVVADDVVPSLRWATAQVQRIERENAEQHRGKAKPVETGEEPF